MADPLLSNIEPSDCQSFKEAKLQRWLKQACANAGISPGTTDPLLSDIMGSESEGIRWAKLGRWAALLANNIGGSGGNYVSYAPQTLTDAQKAQARLNIEVPYADTVANLKGLSNADSAAIGIATCTDMISLYGIGGVVRWNTSTNKWVSIMSGGEITTDILEFYRNIAISGYSAQSSGNGQLYNGFSATPYTQVSSGFLTTLQTALSYPGNSLSTGTTNSGYTTWRLPFFYPALSSVSSMYMQVKLHLVNLSTSAEEFQVRVGLDKGSQTLSTAFAGFIYDRGNVNGFNATNIDKWFALSRNSSTNTIASASGTATPSTNSATLDTIEILATSTSIRLFLNGAEITGSPISTNIPTGAMHPQVTIFKSVGTNSREVRVYGTAFSGYRM